MVQDLSIGHFFDAMMTRLAFILALVLVQPTMALTASSSSRVDLLSIGSHVGAAVSASAELWEDYEWIGHGHGMLLLCGSKICRELNVLREAIAGQVEELEEANFGKGILLRPFLILLQLLNSTVIVVGLALAGLSAALMEVLEDSSPGGHHGAVLLAVNELLELLEASRLAKGRFLHVIRNQVFRLVLTGGATIFALIETVGSAATKKMGAHHGVLLLAISKTLRCIGLLREQVKEKEE